MPPGIHPRGLLIRIHLASLHFDIQEGNKKYNVSSSFWSSNTTKGIDSRTYKVREIAQVSSAAIKTNLILNARNGLFFVKCCCEQ